MSSQTHSNQLQVKASASTGVEHCTGEHEGFTFNASFNSRNSVQIGPRFILLAGKNGSGKTKLLEAIHSKHKSNTLLLGATKLADRAAAQGEGGGVRPEVNPYFVTPDQRAMTTEPMIAGWLRDADNRIDVLKAALAEATDSELRIVGEEAEQPSPNPVHRVQFETQDGHTVSQLSHLSTGQRVLLERLSLALQTLHVGEKPVAILIDEPELLLHPAWQRKYLDALRMIFAGQSVDIFLATHSLYILQQLSEADVSCFQVRRSGTDISTTPVPSSQVPRNLLSSANLVNYLVYDIYSPDLHIELYSHLERRYVTATGTTDPPSPKDLSRWLARVGGQPSSQFQNKLDEDINGPAAVPPPGLVRESFPVFVRNSIHHPHSPRRRNHQDADLKESVDLMLDVLVINPSTLPQ